MISLDYGFRGPMYSIVSACASGCDAIGMGWVLIRSGMADVVVAGAADAPVNQVGLGSFDRLGALCRRNDDYSQSPAPFDKNRDGLVIGEGAGVLVLERESYARARGAEILAELAGYGCTADSYHITAPREDGSGGAQAIRLALQSAEVNAEEVGYISAHGTATPLNDAAETKGIKIAFGTRAYNIPISSTKSMTGHMMGATGALETIFCVQAVREGLLPPTIHYQTPDPDCDLDYVPNTARQAKIRACLNNSLGFGGHNATLCFKAFE
jgi:3-oxoacyl-(acyl-carrier-protein) synthase